MGQKDYEQRRAIRTPSGRAVRIVIRRHGIVQRPQPATILDYSVGGIGIQCMGHVERGDEILLLPDGKLMSSVRYVYRVVRVQASKDTGHVIGAEFVRTEPGLHRGPVKASPEQARY